MQKEDFLEKNKSAIFDEFGDSLNSIGEQLDLIIESKYDESQKNTSLLRISFEIGSLIALYKEMQVLLSGKVLKTKKNNVIGFQALLDLEEKEDD